MKEKIIIVKLGTSSLVNEERNIDKTKLLNIAKQVVAVQKLGHKVVLVSSGAVAAGRSKLHHLNLTNTIQNKQCFAAVGQCVLMNAWAEVFATLDRYVGQLLLTLATIEDKERFLTARDTIEVLLENNIIPIVNENDSVTTAEIKVGDNDNLAAITAILAKANYVYLLTDIDGLYTADPTKDPQATLIKEIWQLDDSIKQLAKGSNSNVGTGGMLTKLQAAEIAASSGITTIIAASTEADIIIKLAEDQAYGTTIHAQQHAIEVRKRWIISAIKAGSLIVDDGAATALLQKGASLLPKGVVAVIGNFNRGDVVKIKNTQQQLLAYGVTNYNNTDLIRIIGKHSSDISKILGYSYGEVTVHRNNMVLK